MNDVFLDTSFAIALSSVTDQNHVRAVELAHQLESNSTRLVTTQAILLEIGNALSKQRYRVAAIELLESLEADPNIEVVLLTNDLYRLALNLFKLELAPDHWGRYAYAIEVGRALLDFGFRELRLDVIFGSTISANLRIARLAEWFGAELVTIRPGSTWMSEQGWSKVDWRITRAQWNLRMTLTV